MKMPEIGAPALTVNPPRPTASMKIATSKCRHGTFTHVDGDDYVGVSLSTYGEYSEQEVRVLEYCLREGQTVIDAGANIGAFTVPMSRLVGPEGRVIAFEPSPQAAELLRLNLAQNDCRNVEVFEAAAGEMNGTIEGSGEGTVPGALLVGQGGSNPIRVRAMTIDSLALDKLSFMKIDVDGHERELLRGARETVMRLRPIIYCENDRQDKMAALIAAIVEMGYRLYWHRPPLFNPDNFAGKTTNMFGATVSIMMVCVPEERGIEVVALDEVSDIRDDDLMFDREIARFSRYVESNPDDLDARWLVAHYENLMQRQDLAEDALAENLRRDPCHVPSLGIKALWDLQRGNWRDGWPGYELRYKQKNPRQFGGHRTHPVPKWDGSPTDKPLLIWNEQGFGDAIMFARFFRFVRERAPNAFLEVQPQLYELFAHSGIAPSGLLFRLGRDLPDYELHCSLPSTAAVLGADEPMIAIDRPYLHADPMMVKNWQGKGNYICGVWGPLGSARIGICTQGSFMSERPYTRDIPADLFTPLHRRHGPLVSIGQVGQFESFADTAAMISNLDLVITVDTAMAHLAGAMGVPTWLLLSFDPDWRWGLKGERTIWYPSVRIFRQPKFRDWTSVIDEVAAALDDREFKALSEPALANAWVA